MTSLINRSELEKKHQVKRYQKLTQLLKILEERKDLPADLIESIDARIVSLNDLASDDRAFNGSLRRTYNGIIQDLAKKLKVVPKSYYRNMWMGLGMAVFGVPIGVAYGTSLGNMAFMGVGIGVGMAIGLAVGGGMDKKAAAEGSQLDIEL